MTYTYGYLKYRLKIFFVLFVTLLTSYILGLIKSEDIFH